MKDEKIITVFTPTYNRGYIIHSLYESLKRQTCKQFEWLVIDDGSSDDTQELFRKWKRERNEFTIRYYKTKNGGKCRAINRALSLAGGKWFFTVDSDDYLTDDAIEKIVLWTDGIKNNSTIKGIVANRGYTPQNTLNYLFEEPYRDMTLLDIYDIPKGNNIVGNGERAFIFETEFHRKYRYPSFKNEKFMTEAVAWNRMAHDGYKMRFYNDIIWIFEYRDDGLTKAGSSVFIDNPRGYWLWQSELERFRGYSLPRKLKAYYSFVCDLCPYYTNRQIASFMNRFPFETWAVLMAHKCLNAFRKLFKKWG